MKYTFYFLLTLSLCSCKKNYTCECNTTVTYYSSPDSRFYTIVIPGNKNRYSEKMSIKNAKSACEHEQVAVQTNFTNWLTNNGRYTLRAGESVQTSCGLK
ncbi:MAG: hypothetical protein JNL60_17825 [Bacteroidia bacterium]|nr:hypothetical protein [Bacteroidia bacterium]